MHVDGDIARDFTKPVTELRERNIDSCLEVSRRVLLRFASIDDEGTAFHERAHMGDGHLRELSVKDVEPHEGGVDHHVLRGGVQRRVGEFEIGEVLESTVHHDEGCDHVNALIGTAYAHGLRPENAPRGTLEKQLEEHGLGAWHDCHRVRGDHVYEVELEPGGAGGLLVEAGGGRRVVEDLYHGGADHAAVAGCAPVHVVCRGAGLPLGWSGERQLGGGAAGYSRSTAEFLAAVGMTQGAHPEERYAYVVYPEAIRKAAKDDA